MICARCGEKPPKENRKECPECLEYSKKKAKEFRVSQKRRGLCILCMNRAEAGSVVCDQHLEKLRKNSRQNCVEVKRKVLEHYGGGKCVWPGCSITDPDMLTLDHIENNGAEDRKAKRRLGVILFRHLIKNDYPEGFQVLCGNHQLKKELMRRRKEIAPKGEYVRPQHQSS